MRAYRNAGFRVEVMIITVPAAMSNQGIVSRYHEQVVDRGHGRLTVQANADRAYTGVLDLADVIDGERLADEVGVFRRGEATPRYSNALNPVGQWQATPTLRAAIESERARPWTPEETADFLRTHTKLRRELGPQWTQRLDEILSQAQPLMNRAREAASEPASTETDPGHAAEPSAGDEVRQALEAARPPPLPRQPARHSNGARPTPKPRTPTAARQPTGRQRSTSNMKPADSPSAMRETPKQKQKQKQKPSPRPTGSRTTRSSCHRSSAA
jgi:Zeta toxin